MSTNRNETVARARAAEVSVNREALKHAFLDNLFYIQGKFPALATPNDYYMALAYAVRDRMLQRWVNTAAAYTKQRSRTVCYLSAEFLMGPHLGNNLINLGIYETARGHGQRPRARPRRACSRRSRSPGWATAASAGSRRASSIRWPHSRCRRSAYGIRYEFGIFQQEIVDGWQVEKTDKWLQLGNPWELARPEWACR